MAHRFGMSASAALALASLLSAGAFAQEFPNIYAPRCLTDELRSPVRAADHCQPAMAHFGLQGPTVMTDAMVDVDATGSIASRADRDHSARGRDPAR